MSARGRRSTRRACLAVAVAALVGCAGGGPAPIDAPGATAEAISRTSADGPVQATVTLAPAKPMLGDRLTLTLQVEAEPGVRVEMPPFSEALGRFAIESFAPREEATPAGGTRLTHVYVLRSPLSGRHRIPGLRIEYTDERAGSARPDGGAAVALAEPKELVTEQLPIEIESALPPGAPRELRPLRGALDLSTGRSFVARFAWAFGVGAVLALAAAAIVLRGRWRRARAERARASAYDVAMARLRRLADAGFPTGDAVDAWYVELSGIVRRYLEDRWGIRAPELTTEEFLREAAGSGLVGPGHRELLGDFLARCDRVKFGGYRPDAAESGEALASARRFLDETRLHADPSAAPAPAEAAA